MSKYIRKQILEYRYRFQKNDIGRCLVAIHTVNFVKTTLILQPAHSDVKSGSARTHENRLYVRGLETRY